MSFSATQVRNTYWSGNGKYQAWVNKIQSTMPDKYYTSNQYMNLFIAMCNIYYDIYNNGGGNLKSSPVFTKAIEKLKQYIGRFDVRRMIKEPMYLEEKTNKVFEKLMQQDLSFENAYLWVNNQLNLVSMREQNGVGWFVISCGAEPNRLKELKERVAYGFKEV